MGHAYLSYLIPDILSYLTIVLAADSDINGRDGGLPADLHDGDFNPADVLIAGASIQLLEVFI